LGEKLQKGRTCGGMGKGCCHFEMYLKMRAMGFRNIELEKLLVGVGVM
jgi:hypothetical protein